MRRIFILPAMAFAVASLAAIGPARADEAVKNPFKTLSCRSQAIAYCKKGCEFGAGPADISLDFAAGTIDYCRGEQCDPGKIKTEVEKGQWDDQTYLLFHGKAKRGGKIWGMISASARTFYAHGDVGEMYGTCTTE